MNLRTLTVIAAASATAVTEPGSGVLLADGSATGSGQIAMPSNG